jgi:kexin
MRLIKAVVFAALAGAVSGEATKRSWHTHDHYVVEHDPLSGVTLAEAANALGVEVIERAGELKDHWVVRALKAESVDTVLATRESLHAWKAGGRAADNHDARHYTERVASGIKYVEKQVLRQRSKRQGPPSDTPAQPDAPPRPVVPAQPDAPVRPITPARPDVPSWKGNETGVPSHDVALHLDLLDPEFGKQWHLVNDENPVRTASLK